jgi:hypothetical protein
LTLKLLSGRQTFLFYGGRKCTHFCLAPPISEERHLNIIDAAVLTGLVQSASNNNNNYAPRQMGCTVPRSLAVTDSVIDKVGNWFAAKGNGMITLDKAHRRQFCLLHSQYIKLC